MKECIDSHFIFAVFDLFLLFVCFLNTYNCRSVKLLLRARWRTQVSDVASHVCVATEVQRYRDYNTKLQLRIKPFFILHNVKMIIRKTTLW